MPIRIVVTIAALAYCSPLLAQRAPLPTTPPESIKAELDMTYGSTPEQELKLDIYRPKTDVILPGCVLIHGGGWVKGDKEKFVHSPLRWLSVAM